MPIQKKLIQTIQTISQSFTILIIIFLLLEKFGLISALNNTYIFKLLLICVGVGVLQFITTFILEDILKVKSALLIAILQFADMFIVVFILGGLVFELFYFSLYEIFILVPMLIIIFFAVYFIEFIAISYEAKEINKIIKKRNNK